MQPVPVLLLWPAVLLLWLLLPLLRGPRPPGLEAPRRLRLLESVNLLLALLSWLGSKLGLGPQVLLMRRLREAALRPRRAAPDPAVSVRDTRIAGVAVRVYSPRRAARGTEEAPAAPAPRPTVVFYHGGGWMFGDVDSYDCVTRFLAKRTGAELISVEYRLAPEWPFPAPLDDCVRVARAALCGGDGAAAAAGPVALCGDSAGGNLAAATALALAREARTERPLPQPVALALLYPALQMIDLNLRSHTDSDAVPVLSRARTAAFYLAYMGAPQNLVPAMLKGQHSSARHRAGLRALVREEEEEAAAVTASVGVRGRGVAASARVRSGPMRTTTMRLGAESPPAGVRLCGATNGGGVDREFDIFGSGIGSGGYGVYGAGDDDDDDGGTETGITDDLNPGGAAAPPLAAGLSAVARACLDPLLCPLAAGDAWLALLPRRLFVLSCEHDVLRDEARALAARARRCGLRVERHHVDRGFHGVLNFFGRDERAGPAGPPGGVRAASTGGDESSDRAACDDDDDSDDDSNDDVRGGSAGAVSKPCWLCAWFWLSPVCLRCSRPIISFECGEEALVATASFLRRSLAAAAKTGKMK